MDALVPSPAGRRAQAVVGALVALSVAAAIVGNAFTPLLLRLSPELLLVVQASYAQMALATTRLDPVTIIAIAVLRRWAGEIVAFAAGRVLGPRALAWYARRGHDPLAALEGLDERWWRVRDLVIVVVPQPLLSAVFGVLGTPVRRFVVLKGVGTLWSVTAFVLLVGVVPLPLAAVADLVEANALLLTVLAAVGLAGWAWRRRDAGRD
ncbi:MAG: hypothetical protein R6T85_00310 [Egibacteraceae bacterium]